MSGRGLLTRRLPPVEALKLSEAREFRGGLNTFDTPLNLSPRYLTELRNLYPDTNGRLRLRYGTSLFADVTGSVDEIVGVEYFANAIIAVGVDGKIVSVNSAGEVMMRWDSGIAATRPGSPDAWSTGLTFISFAQFGGQLIICNGVDKPLIMDELYTVNYLADLGTGSNVNIPRAKYCVTHNNYLVLAGAPDDFETLFISAKATSGTFFGDPGPDNDAVNFSLNTYVNRGSTLISGLGSFRDKLIVSFPETLLAIQLGTYVETDHVPRVDDVIENHGSVSHRGIVPLGDDILFIDQAGVASVQRALITATLSPVRESTLISTDIQRAMAPFTPAQLERHVFAIYDRIAQHILFFIPKSTNVTTDTDNNVYVYCFDRSQKFRAWAFFDQMRYRCGTRTTEGRVFLASGTKVYFYHNQFQPLHNDYAVGGEQYWEFNETWNDGTGWEELENAVGEPIPYAFTTPWTDMRNMGKVKYSKYANITAEGAGSFTLQMFVDDFPNAELSMPFEHANIPVGTDISIRPASNAQLFAWPQKFERMRLRIEGQSDTYIAFVSLGVMYLVGSIRR